MSPERITIDGTSLILERATAEDVPGLAALLADDPLGSRRETANLGQYMEAFSRINADPAQYLLVLRTDHGEIVGTAQLTLIPYLVRGGSTRLQVEAVRLSAGVRGRGVGSALFSWIHDFGRRSGASLVQLTSDNTRINAQRFYENLGYIGSHMGYKYDL